MWTSPPSGQTKSKFDGKEKGNPGKDGSRGIIRNSFGISSAVVYFPLGAQMNHYAEASVALQITKLVKDQELSGFG